MQTRPRPDENSSIIATASPSLFAPVKPSSSSIWLLWGKLTKLNSTAGKAKDCYLFWVNKESSVGMKGYAFL